MRAQTIDGLTEKERLLVANKLKGLSNTQAAKEAGYAPAYADRQAMEIMRRPHVQAAIKQGTESLGDILERCGITIQSVLEPILLGLKATRKVNTGSVKRPKWEDEPDIQTRFKAAAIAWKMLADVKRGASPAEPLAGTLSRQNLEGIDEIELQRLVFKNKTN